MAVFKNLSGGYEMDFSEAVVEKLENLWQTDKEKYEDLEEYIYSKFDWIAGLHTDAPSLFNSFENEEEAVRCDKALHKEIHKWFKKIESNNLRVENLIVNKKSCYDCMRKTECYTKAELENLKPDETYKDKTGYDCGVTFTNYEEMREFIYVIGEAISEQSKKTQNKIIGFIADKYNLPVYNVRMEFER